MSTWVRIVLYVAVGLPVMYALGRYVLGPLVLLLVLGGIDRHG